MDTHVIDLPEFVRNAIANPHQVTAPGGKVKLFFVGQGEVSANFQLMATCAAKHVMVRITGGCKGMNEADKIGMIHFFLTAYKGFRGLAFTGATRQTVNDQVDLMVTDAAGFLAMDPRNAGCVALGTAPLVDIPTLQGNSRLVLDSYGTAPAPNMSGIMLVQDGDSMLDWDGDLKSYFAMMDRLIQFANFKSAHIVAWNGGAITQTEIMLGAKRGWPIFLVNGSGRVTQDLALQVRAGNFSAFETAGVAERHFGNIIVVDKDDPMGLRDHLISRGIITA